MAVFQALLCTLFLCALLAVNGSPFPLSGIMDYSVTVIKATQLASLPLDHWAKYDESVAVTGRLSSASEVDDSARLDSADFFGPFFFRDNLGWYVAADGFLSPVPYGMCGYFCSNVQQGQLIGNYQFNEGDSPIPGGGGDWPMIALYVEDLNPVASGGMSGIFILNEADGSVSVAYDSIRTHGTESNNVLTAQVTLFPNGTIIMRYKQLPTSFGSLYSPSVGLVFTKSLRKVVETPTAENGIIAIRFDPVYDPCLSEQTADDCLAQASCGWCAAMASCMTAARAEDVCPPTQMELASPSPGTPGEQRFYNLTVDYDGELADMSSQPGVQKGTLNLFYYDKAEFFPLSFMCPFFNETRAMASSYVSLISANVLSMFSTSQPCNPIQSTCVNGNYTFSVLPFQTKPALTSGSSSTRLQLGKRVDGDFLCNRTECSPAFVLQIAGLTTGAASSTSIYYQLILDEDGEIDIVVESTLVDTALLYSYPAVRVGLTRYGADDLSSVVLSPGTVSNRLHLHFTPASMCPTCGLHGFCNTQTRQCECATGFSGTQCNECASGYYGSDCQPCPTCVNSGTCDDGVRGSGNCQCPTPYSGRTCSTTCASGVSTACTNCNAAGGYCDCGRCVCKTGWYGESCSRQDVDPCIPHSLAGCPSCTANPNCSFCFDYTCFSPSLSGTSRGYTCSYTYPAGNSQLCALPIQFNRPSFDFGIVTVIFVVAAVVVCFILLVLVTVCMLERRMVYDIQVAVAAGGAADFHAVRHEREVVQAAFVPPEYVRPGNYVVAIPLKQISLKKLYKRQNGLESRKGN